MAASKGRQPDEQARRIVNKKARFNYHILERIEAGIALTGTEVKSLREGRASLDEAYARIVDGEAWLVGCSIEPYRHAGPHNHDPVRKRKLLLHRREINRLLSRVTQKGLTLVPLSIYFNRRGLAKVELALARGRSAHDKRRQIKERQLRREIERVQRRYSL